MTLAVNIINSRVELGLFDGGSLVFNTALSADPRRCAEEYAVLADSTFKLGGASLSGCEGLIISSVVPQLTRTVAQAAETLTGATPLLVGAGVKTGLDIKIDHHSQLGGDIVANAVAALDIFTPPMIIIDIDDYSTYSIINQKGELTGVVICAGPRTELDALSQNAAELPYVSLDEPKSLIGKNTSDSMNSGAVYAQAFTADGIIETVGSEFNCEVNIAATGIYAPLCLKYRRGAQKITYEPRLTLKGLNKIYGFNSGQNPAQKKAVTGRKADYK